MDWPILLQTVGVSGTLLVFFVIETKRREDRMLTRLDEIENYSRTELTRLVQDCTAALNRNSEVMERFAVGKREGAK